MLFQLNVKEKQVVVIYLTYDPWLIKITGQVSEPLFQFSALFFKILLASVIFHSSAP